MEKNESAQIVYLTAPQAAVFAGISYARLQQLLLDDDPPPRESDKKYRSDKLGEWTRRRAVKMHLGARKNNPVDIEIPDALNPIQERARKDKEQADKTALENQVRRGELVEGALVASKWTEILMKVRSKLLRIPWAAAPLLLGHTDQVKIQIVLEDQIRDALSELAATDEP
jgi:phage terminase Nu1 subunit (DNA packaging protein)